MAFSEFGGFFDTIKPVTKSEFDTSSSSSSLPKLGGSSGLPGTGKSGWGKGLKKLGKGGLADISETSDSYHGQNLRTLDSLGGIDGFWAYDRAFSAKDTTGKGVAGNPELQAAIREITGPNAIIQDEGGNIVTAQSAADAVSKMNNQSASGQPATPAEPAAPAQAEPATPAQAEPATPTPAENGQIFQQGLGKKGDKIRMPGGAISYKTATVGSQSQPNPYDEAQPSNPYDEGQQQFDAESAWYDNAVRTASKKLYGIDIDALEMPDVNGQHIENPVLDNWKSNLREFIRLNNESYRRKLSKKEVEAWQAAGNLAYSSQGSLKLFSALMKNNKIPADADTSEVWNDAANAIVAMDQGKLDKYFPGLYDSNMYQAAMKQAQNGDTTQLEAVSQLLQPVIDSRAAAEAPGNPGTVLTSGDFWKWMYDTAGDALVRGVLNVKGFAKDLYYRARISDDDAPMTDAERAENERLKAARLYNLEETHRVDEWADKDMQRINDASEIYKTQELIRRGRDYMNDRDRENSFWGGVASTWDALKRAPVYTIGSYSAESADTLVGMAVGGGVGGGVGKLTQFAVNRALNGAFRSAAGAALAGGEGAAEAGAAALGSAARKINWYTFAGETLGSGASGFVNIGAMNVAGDAQAAASRPVAELVKDPEFAKFYAEQSDSVLTGSVLPVMAVLSSSDDSRMPELRSLVSQLQLNQVDANGQPRAITAEDKKRILAFYDNPLVQQAVDSGSASSPLINRYRSYLYNRTWDNNIWQNSMLGVAEGALSPVAGGVFRGRLGGVGGVITDRVKSKLAKAGLGTAYVLGEGAGTEALEQIVSNIGMNQAQGRDPYENLMRNVGESFMAGAIISGVLSTPNAAIAMFRHSGKAQDTGSTGDTGSTSTGNGPQDNGPSGTSFSPFDSGIYTDASGLDSGSYDHGASFAESVRNDPAVRRASLEDYNVPGSDKSDTPVFHDSEGNEITAPSAAELDRDIDAVRTARDTLAKQYGAVEAKLKQTTDEAERKALTERASKMRDVWKEQTQVLRTLHAARRYYKAKAQTQGQAQEQTQQTQEQAQEQTQQTQEQTQEQTQQPKARTGRQITVREVKEGRRSSKPTDEQQALLDKLNEYEKTQPDGARWEAINDHELVRRKPKGKSRAYNMDYLTVGDDGKWSIEPLRNLTNEQKKLWEAYRSYKKWSPKLGAEELYDNGQLTGVAWGSTGKGSKNRNKGNITFAQMEQELAASGVNWKGTEEEQTEEQAAPAAEEQTEEQAAPAAEEQAQPEPEEVPAKPSCEQEFDEAISNLNPEDSTSVDDLLDAAHALVEEITASSNSTAKLKAVYDRLDKALLNLEFGQRIAYIGPSTKDWLSDVRHRQMMFHLARTLGAKTKTKSPNYPAFDLLMGFIINSSDMLSAIDNYRLHMGDGFVDAVKTVAGSDAWKKSGKFVDDYRAYRGAQVRGWSDIAQNVIAVIAPAPAAEQELEPAAPLPEQEPAVPASELESSAEFKKLPEPLQKYLLNPEHKLNSSDWSKLAEVAKLTPAENGKLTTLVAESDNAAVLITGTGYTTAFLRFLKSEGFEIGEVCEVQIKQEDEQAAAAKKQAEEAKRKAEEEQKLQSMLMPEEEQTGDWGNYNSKLSRADHVVPVHEGLSIDLTGGAENLVPVQQMTDKPLKRSELRARELNADSNVHATIYTKSGTGKDRLIAVPFEEDAANSKLISENPKRLADWLNMKLPDGASWAKGYSPLDVLIAFFRQISSGKKPKAGTKYYLKYYKGLTVQSVPIPAGGIGESSTGGSVYANKIKDSGGINGLPALYAGLIQELISINNHIAADHKGSFNSDVLQSDPVIIEAGNSVIVIGVETGIGQPYSGTVLISKDEARKEGMLADEPAAEEESAPAAQPQAQAQPQTESAQPKADTSGINGQLRGFIISYITSPQRQNIPDIIDRVPIKTIQASLKADITREQIQAVYDEAVEAVRTAMSRGTPLTDEERAKYGLTNDRWISYISENMTDGTEHSEGQAGAERDSTADSGEEPGESTSETGSENSGFAGRTGEAAESAGDVGTGTSGERPAEGNNSNTESLSAAAEGTDESSVPVNPAPAAPAAGDGAGVVTGEGSGSTEDTSDQADAGESAEQPDRREPPVAEPNNDQTNEELAKVDLARKALKYYKDHTELSRGAVREAIANSLDSQDKLLAKLPAGYKDIVLDTLTDAVLNVMDSFHALNEYIGDVSPLRIQFGKEAKYEPDVNRITIPVATALKMAMPAAQKVFGKFTHDPDSDTFVYAKQTYDKADILKNLLPAMLHAFMWHECAHALFHGVHYNRYKLSAPLRNAIDSTVDQFIRATGIKLPEGHENWARDEIFATGMEMAVLYMRSGNTPATQAVALLTNRFVKAMPELSKLVCATYEPLNHLSGSLKQAIDLINGPLEMLYNGTDKRLMGRDEDSMRIAWKVLFTRNPKAVNRYVQLLSFMSGEMLNTRNALSYVLNTISGMADNDDSIDSRRLNGRYAMSILRPTMSPDNSALGDAKITIANELNLKLRDLELLVPDIDQRINDDIAMAQRLKSETEQYTALATDQSDFNAMCSELESALLSGIDADTGAAAQAKPNSQLERNGAANPTPAQEQRNQVEEDKTQGEREKASETANALADNSKLKEDKTPEQEQAEQNADNLITAGVAAANANANENVAPLNLSLTSPYIQEITANINAAIDKSTSSTQYMQLNFMLDIWRDLIESYGDWLGRNLLRGDVSSNDLMHILDERLYYASRHNGAHYSDSQMRLMAVWLNSFITNSKLGSAIKQAYTGKDWERDDNVIIENSDGTRKVEERQFLSDFHNETNNRIKAASAAKAAAAKAKADAEAAEAAKAAADAKARALTPDEISEELEKPAPLSPREQQDWKLETELDDQLNIFNRPNKKDTDDGVENAEDLVGHTNVNIDENSAAVKVAAYLRMATGDVDDDAVSQWLGFLFENGWGLKKLLLAKTHNKEELHMTLADFRQVMLDGEIDADVVEKIIYALDNYTNLFDIIETHHPDFRTAPANKQLGKYLGEYAESDRIENLSERYAEITDYEGTKDDIILAISEIVDGVYTIDTSITAGVSAANEIKKGQQQTEGKQKIQLPVFTSGKQLAEWKKTASKEELAAWNAKIEEIRKQRELEKLMESQAENAIAHFADKEADAKEAEKAAFFKQYADKYRNSNRVNFDPADPESELSILLSLLHGEMDLSINDFYEIFADKTAPFILHEITGKWQDSGAEDFNFTYNRPKAADPIAEKMIRGFFAKYGESISTEILNAKDPAAYTRNLIKKFSQYCDDNFKLYRSSQEMFSDIPETKLNRTAKYWAEYCLQHVIEPIAYAKSNTVPRSGEQGHPYDPFKDKDEEALKVIKDVLGSKALRAVPFMRYAEISNAEAEALLSDETDIDSNDTDSGVRYYASEANDMTEDEAQQTIDETTASEPDPETPADTGEDTEAAEEELAGVLDDEDSSETPDTDAESQAAAINLDADTLGDDVADRELDDTGMDVLDTLFTPDELKEMAPDLAGNAAKLTRVVKTYGTYRRAFMEQMRNAFSANRVFRENKYVRNYMNHFIDNWDRSIASLETWAIENYQGAVSPEDNPVIQSILLARRMASSYTEAVNDILQRGMTMNENGARVRILDENGKPVESVLDATTRMYDKLKELGVRRDVLDTKENFRKDVGMFRTLLHTIEANEYKYEEMKAQYAKLTEDYNAEASKPNPDKAVLDKIYNQRSALRLDIENFEKLMKKDSLNDVKIDSRFTLPMGGRSIAMAHNELDALYAKYDTALKDAGVDDATRAEVLKEMIVSFNVAYKYAIQEMDMLSARSGLLSEATILQRHNFKYYTPLRQDIGDGRGRNIEARKGSVTPAVDAITNYAMQAIRNSGSVSRNVLGMTLFDAWNTMHDEYERIYHDPNASPEEKMRIISHQSVGETYSFNGLLLIRRQDMERIPEGDERFDAFRKQAIFVEIVQPAGEDELVDSNLERFWIGFDPDVIGRARKSEVKGKPVSSQRDLHGIQNDAGEDPDKPGYILYPEVQPRDYSDAGRALVDIAYEPSAKLGNFLKTCGFLTRTASEAMTTFNPLFALKSAISDFRERITRLGRREFADSNGHKVSGVRIALRMWRLMMNPKFLGTTFKYSVELASHKVTGNNTQYRKYLSEMHKYGIIGGVQQQMVATGGSRRSLFGMNATEKIQLEIEKQRALQEQQTNKEAETLVSKLYRILGEKTHGVSRTRIGKFLHAVHNAAIGWSNMFYNVPLAAQYVAMRECGLSAQSAAADTAKAMDFTNRGYYHKVGSKFVSFLTSITHGTANMLDSYGINRNTISSNPYLKQTGYARRMNIQSYAFKAARLSAYLALVQVLLYAVGASLRPHEPDKRKAGQQLIDNMPLRNMYFLPVPILQWLGIQDENGVVAKLAGGFGEDRLALNLAWGLERWSRGKATLSEVAGSYMVNFTRNATPFEAPNFDMTNNPARYMAYSAGHSVPLMAWAVDAALNITYNGRTLDGQFGPAMGQRAYEEHNAYVDIAYKDLSKTMYDVLGVNISPSTIKSMYEGMGYGPVVQGLMQLALHIGDSVPRSRLDPNWANANVNAIAQFFGATSLGNKMPDKPYVYISQLRKYYNDLFVEGGVSSMLKANGAGTKVAAIQQTMRMMGFSSAEIADMVNMHEMDRKLTGILKQENALIDLRRNGGISVDQFTKRMNGLIRQANTLQTNYMKGSYYYRGVYPKRSGIPEKYRARLERENRLDAIRRANAIVDKESK